MFNFRTQSLNAIVWLLAVSQLLLQPAAGLLHSGCDGHSHAEVASTAPHSFWHTFELAWHWVTGHHGCQHSHSKHSESEGPWKSRPNQPKTCAAGPANCLVKSPPSDVQCGNSHDPPIPVHDLIRVRFVRLSLQLERTPSSCNCQSQLAGFRLLSLGQSLL